MKHLKKTLYQILLDKGYTKRSSQEEMFELVDKTIKGQNNVVMIEAPTGTGKSFGYLIPIIDNNKQAIISTKTKILQEQLRKDLEFLATIINKYLNKQINFVIIKGKGNYLCLDRFYERKKNIKISDIVNEKKVLKEIENLIVSNWNGDLEKITANEDFKQEININQYYCDSNYRKICPYINECFYYAKLKKEEEKADIIVLNHSLLPLKQIKNSENMVLIIDEAHELDEALVRSLVDNISVVGLLKLISQSKKILEKINITQGEYTLFQDLNDLNIASIFKTIFEDKFPKEKTSIILDDPSFVSSLLEKVFVPFQQKIKILEEYIIKYVRNNIKEDFNNQIATTNFQNFLFIVKMFDKTFVKNLFVMEKYYQKKTLQGKLKEQYEKKREQELMLSKIITEFNSIKIQLSNMISILQKIKPGLENNEMGIVISKSYYKPLKINNYKIETFPIFPRGVIQPEKYQSVILTSATLDKELTELSLGIAGEYYSLKPVFDYKTINFVIKNVSPNDKKLWESTLSKTLERLKEHYKKILVLLTNYEQVNYIKKFHDDYHTVFQNEIGLAKAIEMIKEGKKKVLVGVDSIWTGIDIKGEKGILMAKLPFDAPDEPLQYYRRKYFEAKNGNFFYYYKKRALLQFKQGFGRLMRDEKDKGTIVLCDNRICHDRYKEFLHFVKNLGCKISVSSK